MAAISAGDNFKGIFLNEKFCILIRISMKFVPKGPIDNKRALIQAVAWCRISVRNRHSPLIDCKIVILILIRAQLKKRCKLLCQLFDSSGPHIFKPCTKNCDTSRITWTVTPLPLMVVLMTAAPWCLNKDLHINCYQKETWIKFDNCS